MLFQSAHCSIYRHESALQSSVHLCIESCEARFRRLKQCVTGEDNKSCTVSGNRRTARLHLGEQTTMEEVKFVNLWHDRRRLMM